MTGQRGAYFTVGLPVMAQLALLLFLLAAAGGAFMNLNFHWKMLALPKWLVLVHAGIAICGFPHWLLRLGRCHKIESTE